jgi:multiple sugar transport system ATP-binding protein
MELTLGIRPEYLVVAKDNAGPVKAQVETIERLGDRSLVHARLSDGSKVIGSDPGMTKLGHGDAVSFNVDGTRVTVFDQSDRAYHAAA